MIARALLILFVLALAIATPARADETVTIKWQPHRGASRYEIELSREGAVVMEQSFPTGEHAWKLSLPSGDYLYRIRVFDSRGRAGPWSDLTPFTVKPSAPKTEGTKAPRFDLGLGVGVAGSLVLPTLTAALTIGPKLAVGACYVYANDPSGGSTLRLNGLLATLTFFPSAAIFRGFFAQLLAGPYFYSASDGARSESKISFTAGLAAGWQWHPFDNAFYALGTVGALYASRPALTLIDPPASGFLPSASLRLGVSF